MVDGGGVGDYVYLLDYGYGYGGYYYVLELFDFDIGLVVGWVEIIDIL